MTMLRRSVALTVGAFMSVVTVSATPAIAEDYFEGKTIEVIIGFASGGTDTAGRIVASQMSKYIPGHPTVIVKNMPGGGSLTAQNYLFERARPDGLTIGFNPFQAMAQLTEREGVRFDYSKFTYIAGVQGAPFVGVANTDLAPDGLNGPEDIGKIDKRLVYAGRNPLHAIDVLSTAAFDLLGMTHAYVPGYSGSADLTTSMAQKETTMTGAGSVHWLQHLTPRMIEKGDAVTLFQTGTPGADGIIVADPTNPDAPLFEDVLRQTIGGEPSGDLYEAYRFAQSMLSMANWIVVGPPGMDPEVTEILRQAVEESMADPRTIEETLKIEGNPYAYIDFATAEKVLNDLSNADPEIVDFWKKRVERQASGG